MLATDGLLSFVIFLYADDKIEWTTGAASGGSDGFGGTPAQVGYDAGDRLRYYAVSGSCTDDIINITQTSNIGIPGMWVFKTDNEAVAVDRCHSFTTKRNGMYCMFLHDVM